MNTTRLLPAALCVLAVAGTPALAQDDPKATEQWTPVPPVVTPGTPAGQPPSDAVRLFDGHDLSAWEASRDGSPARWKVHDGVLTVDKATGNIQTRRRFRNYQLHLEWQVPKNVTGEGQARGNSGVFLASTGPGDEGYEIQIMDSYDNPTYVNGQAGSVYKQSAPLANAMRPPGQWQTYDIVWTAPVFAADGTLVSPAYVTLFHNGVLVQNHTRLTGETRYIGKPSYTPYTDAPIKLQAHGDPSPPISFRDIWVRPLD
ncbi:DUF1080 domain-containing protein [Luteibacter sp. PPL201]|uniref:DUF1080 domain-containing protein n=1 Tax=Luteibacter sahnii TaxID=3021977 RepID=A0ABT6BE28_9GAMM|nr:DUF1080 domain-containing protein [Luteibacter sp. PPL193]MDY1548838.1 DUF1080 domain-containing protein [Luteibacter sp. PPL193]